MCYVANIKVFVYLCTDFRFIVQNEYGMAAIRFWMQPF
jgi:hypothetical protein